MNGGLCSQAHVDDTARNDGAVSYRRAGPDDFATISAIVESSYRVHDPGGAPVAGHATSLTGRPFSWFGDAQLSWWLAELDGTAVGYALWRHVGRNAHLHALFVAADAQRQGVGSDLLRFHLRQAIAENPALESYTLHVREDAAWARPLYLKHGYVERAPRSLPTDGDSGLSDWARVYERHGWPEPGKLLMVRLRSAST